MSNSLPVIRRGTIPAGDPQGDHSSFPFRWQTATAQWWDDLGLFPAHPEVPPLHHIPTSLFPRFITCAGGVGIGDWPTPPFISPEPPLRTAPLLDPPRMQPLTHPSTPTVAHLPCLGTLLMGLGIR